MLKKTLPVTADNPQQVGASVFRLIMSLLRSLLRDGSELITDQTNPGETAVIETELMSRVGTRSQNVDYLTWSYIFSPQ
jgi:hypothetical protein